MNLVSALRARAAEAPGRTAHTVLDGEALTFGEWQRRATARASDLAESIDRGAWVGLEYERDQAIDAAVSLLAVWIAGGIPVLLPVQATGIAPDLTSLGLQDLLGGRVMFPGTDRQPTTEHKPSSEGHDAALVFTSGTDGSPKLVALPWADVAREVPVWWIDEVMVNSSPLYTADALGNLVAPLLDGRHVLTSPSVTSANFETALGTFRPTYLKLVPSMIRLIRETMTATVPSVTRIGVGSAAVGVDDVAALTAVFPNAAIYVDYSSTESGRANLVRRVDDYLATGWTGELGTPRFGGSVRLVAEDGCTEITGPGQLGEIQLRTVDGSRRRVFHQTGALVPVSSDGWIPMGDLGEYDDQGRLWFRARRSEVVNVGGEKVVIRDVEATLLSLPGVRNAAVSALPHNVLGVTLGALVVATADVDHATVRRTIIRTLRGASRPARIVFADAVPLNANGKVDSMMVGMIIGESAKHVEAATAQALMDSVRPALGDRLGPEDAVDDSSASSIALLLLTTEIDSRFGVTIDIVDLLLAPSFGDLAADIRMRQAKTAI